MQKVRRTVATALVVAASACAPGDQGGSEPRDGGAYLDLQRDYTTLSPGAYRAHLAAADTVCASYPVSDRPQDRPDTLILKTGSFKGGYHRIGCAIARVLEKDSDLRVVLVNGNGSVENLRDLAAGRVDLAIAQSDIANHAFEGEGQFARTGWSRLAPDVVQQLWVPEKRVRAIMGLYEEQVLIIAREEDEASLSRVRDIGRHHRLVVDGEGSGTYGNARDIITDLGLPVDSMHLGSVRSRVALRDTALLLSSYEEGRADIVFLTAGRDSTIDNLLRSNRARILPMSADKRQHLAAKRAYYINRPDSASLGVRSLLLATNALAGERAGTILEAIREDLGQGASAVTRSTARMAEAADSALTQGVSVPIHSAAADVFCEDIRKACAFTALYHRTVAGALLGILIGFMLLGAAFVPRVRRPFLRLVPSFAGSFGPEGWVSRYRGWLIPVFATAVIVLGTVTVTWVELDYSRAVRADSEFANRTFGENLIWLMVFAASGSDQGLQPGSSLARVISAFTVLAGLGGSIVLAGVVTSPGFARRMRMDLRRDTSLLRNHIVVCGWNRNAPGLVRALCADTGSSRGLTVAIVAGLEDDPVDRHGLEARETAFISGAPTRMDNLLKAGLDQADTVVVLADEAAAEADRDARTLMIASQVEKHCQVLLQQGRRDRDIHTVVELVDPDNRAVFESAFVDQILCLAERAQSRPDQLHGGDPGPGRSKRSLRGPGPGNRGTGIRGTGVRRRPRPGPGDGPPPAGRQPAGPRQREWRASHQPRPR